jgi:hypothetical protein
MLLDALTGQEANVHPARHLLGSVVPTPVFAAATHRPGNPARSTHRIVVSVEESGQLAAVTASLPPETAW